MQVHAVVRRIDGHRAYIAIQQPRCAGCTGQCADKGAFSRLFSPRLHAVSAPEGCRVGDELQFSLPESSMSRLAWLGYGLPLSGLLGGALLGSLVSDGISILAATLGLLSGLSASGWWMRRHRPTCQQLHRQVVVSSLSQSSIQQR
ncbi:SoxR reducing system RseC family protein [Chitinivorax tropicus]|nr:SoxR reducing system RseC family protein [Chitinivorax tropicus]